MKSIKGFDEKHNIHVKADVAFWSAVQFSRDLITRLLYCIRFQMACK